MKQKPQSPAQRVANPVWLRAQIQEVIDECNSNIEEDQELAYKACDDTKCERYLERVASHWHWKCRLERILRGTTSTEDLQMFLKQEDIVQ